MSNRRVSVRSRLLASVMVGFFPATAAMAADTTVGPGQTVGQVQFSGSDHVTIAAGGTVSTTNQGAVVMTGDSTGVVIDNAGTITATGLSGIAIPAGSPTRAGPITITNSGTINAPNAVGIFLSGATGPVSISNSGTITGAATAIITGSGADTLNLSTGSVINGQVAMGGGVDTVNLAGSLNTRSTSQTFGAIFGSEVTNVNSGYWTLNKELGTDQLNIASGATLHLDTVGAAPGEGGFVSSSQPFLTVVNNGALIQDTDDTRLDIYADSLHLGGAGTVELKGGGTLQYGANVTLTGATTVTNGTLVVTGDNIASPINVAAQGTLRVGAAFSAPDADGYVTLAVGGGSAGSVAGNIANSGAVIFDRANASTYAGVMSGSGSMTKSGAGVLTLTADNTYTGVTTIEAGTLKLGDGGTTGSVAGDIVNNGALVYHRDVAFPFYEGAISGTGSFTKVGSGDIVLLGENTYTGPTTIEGGTVQVGAGSNRGSITSDVTIAAGAHLTFLRSDTSTYVGDISGAGQVTKFGGGALVLTGDATHTGTTRVEQGTLQIGAGGTTGSISGSVVNAGSVVFNRSDDTTFTGSVSGAGSTTKLGAGTLTVTGGIYNSGGTTITAGTLKIGDGGATGALVGNVVNNGALVFDRSTDYGYYNVISGTGSVTKAGGGELFLGRANTYTGGTNVTAGGLTLSGSVIGLTTLASGTRLTITSTGAARVIAGDGVTVTNAGTIDTPLLTTGSASSVNFGNAGNTLNNSGVIRSYNGNAVRFGAGNDTLNLSTGSAITGSVFMGGGADTVNLAGSLDTKSASQTFGAIFESEITNVNSGYWTLNKELGTDQLNIAGGATLELDSVGAAPGEGGFVSSSQPFLTVVNNGALIQNTDDTRLDIYANDLHLSGTGTVELKGGGALQYGQNITLTGATTVTNGMLVVTGDNLVTPITVGAQGTLRVGAAFSAPDVDGFVTLASGGGTTGSLTGNIVNNGAVIFDRSNASAYSGEMSGSGTVTKTGAGVLTLSGANTYTSATTVTGGGLIVSAPFASSGVSLAAATNLTFTGPNALAYGGVVSGAGSVAKTGTGMLTLSGASTYTGGTTVSGGGLTVSGSIIGLTTLASGTTLNIASTGSVRVVNGDGVTVTNAGTIDTPLVTTGSLASVNLGNAGNTLNNSGVIRSYNGNAVRFGSGADTLNLSTGSAITGSVFMGAGADTVNLAGTSSSRSASQTFGRIFEAETVNVNSGYWTLLGELGTEAVSIAGGATLDIDDVTAVGGAFISATGPTTTVTNNGAVILNTADDRLDIFADSLHLSGSGTFQLTGGGMIQYGANVSMTGATTITNGTVIVTGDNIASPFTVGAQGALRIGAAYSAPDADGFVTLVSGGGTTGSVAGNIANNGAVIFDRSTASAYAGAMSGTGTVTKSGAGVLSLTGANTYTGATTVTGGSLVVAGPFASSGVSVASGAGLAFAGPNALTYAGVVSGAGGLTKAGTGVATLSGANTYSGATTVLAGGLTVTGSIASQSVSVASGATFTFGSAANQTYGGVVSGAGSLGKSGAGALTLTGANTYTGATSVTDGSLILATTLGSNVNVAQGGTLQIGTGGTTGHLTGALRADGTVIFNRSDDYVYAGAFSGNGSLIKRGAGLLTLDGLYTFSGTTTIEAGTIKITQLDAGGSLVVGSGSTVDLSGGSQTVGGLAGGTGSMVNIQNATLTVNQAPSTTPTVFNGALTGAGSLVVTGGGILDLAGNNTYTGPTTVNGGTLKVNGSISSPVTVNSGGTLGGSGTINGAVTIGSGGSISPGNSPGVTNIAGPLTLASGASMIVEVDPTAAIKNDRINVTAGSATIAAGAKLDVRPLGAIANYDRVSDYTILTATGGVNGTFGNNVTSTMALLTPVVSYSTNEVSLRLIRNDISFASLADTGNQAAVAAAAEATGPSGVAYGALVGQDAAGARAGYDALSGELYGAAGSLLIEEGRHQRATLLRQAASRGTGAWARIRNGEATIDPTAGSAEASNRSFGFAGGGQIERAAWNLGFGLAYDQSDIDVMTRASTTEVDTLRAGVYAGRDFYAGGVDLDRATWRVRFGADIAKHDFDAKRGVVFPTINETVAARYDGSSRQFFGEVAYVVDMGPGVLEPFVELAGVWAKTDAFAETGGTLGLSVAEQERNLTFATIGARYEGQFTTNGGTSWRPYLSLAWRRASGDVEGTSTAAFGTSSFTVVGASIAKDTALVDAGVGFDLSEAISGSVSYSGALASDAKDHAIRAGLFVRF